jgi:hypothetical protein
MMAGLYRMESPGDLPLIKNELNAASGFMVELAGEPQKSQIPGF